MHHSLHIKCRKNCLRTNKVCNVQLIFIVYIILYYFLNLPLCNRKQKSIMTVELHTRTGNIRGECQLRRFYSFTTRRSYVRRPSSGRTKKGKLKRTRDLIAPPRRWKRSRPAQINAQQTRSKWVYFRSNVSAIFRLCYIPLRFSVVYHSWKSCLAPTFLLYG